MNNFHLPLSSGKIHCHRFGSGPNLLIALHGNGSTGRIFEVMEAKHSQEYTIFAPDLPLHGKSQWKKRDFSSSDMQEMLVGLRSVFGKMEYTALGHSFGARIWMFLLPELSDAPKSLHLVTPDGFGSTGMWMAERVPAWLRRGLQRVANRPEIVAPLLYSLQKTRVIPAATAQFLKKLNAQPHKRNAAFALWHALDHFQVAPSVYAENIQLSGIETHIYLGKRDAIVPPKAVERYADTMPNAQLHRLDCGHLAINADFLMR